MEHSVLAATKELAAADTAGERKFAQKYLRMVTAKLNQHRALNTETCTTATSLQDCDTSTLKVPGTIQTSEAPQSDPSQPYEPGASAFIP